MTSFGYNEPSSGVSVIVNAITEIKMMLWINTIYLTLAANFLVSNIKFKCSYFNNNPYNDQNS